MSTTLDNGSIWPINSDNYNLCPDLATAGNSLSVVTHCTNTTARDALTKFTGRTIWLASTGQIQIWNGSRWSVGSTTLVGEITTTPLSLAGTSYGTVATVNITTLGGSIELKYDGVMQNENSGTYRSADVQWTVDGAGIGGTTFAMPFVSGQSPPVSVGRSRKTTVAAGAHTINLQTRCPASGAAVTNVSFDLRVWENPI